MNSLSQAYFDQLYARDEDPWSFATSAYEAAKYARSLRMLAPHYANALEIGCSIGVFTQQLALHCGILTALDISDLALARARKRCADLPHVHFRHAAFPHEGPTEPVQLVTCCEVGYYWSDGDLALARDRIAGLLEPGGDLLLVHFLPHVDDYVREGDAVHEAFLADERFRHAIAYRAERYRLDLLQRR